jgi:hypothetical protein
MSRISHKRLFDTTAKVTATQLDLLMHLLNGEGHIKDWFGESARFYSLDGSVEFGVRHSTIEALMKLGCLNVSFRAADFDRYTLSKLGEAVAWGEDR